MNLNNYENKQDYTIWNDVIVIHHYTNRPINFNEIDEFFSKIIFSDYDDVEICVNQKNEFNNKYSNNYTLSVFNQNIILPKIITHLIFGFSYNQPILTPLTNDLILLTFGESFNQIIILPENLTYLAFGKSFNQYVELPNSLTHLTLNNNFSYSINLAYIKYLNINCNNTDLIENFPNSLEEIIFGKNFIQPIYKFPNKIKRLVFLHDNYNQDLNNLPDSVKKIRLNKNYNKQILNIPNNLKLIKCHYNYKFTDYLQLYKSANNLNYEIKLYN